MSAAACASCETSKAGFNRGKQRYYCRSCRRWFRAAPIVPGERKSHWSPSKSLPSRGHLILSLQAMAQRLGRTPTTTDITALASTKRSLSLKTFYEVFGSFPEAVKKAALEANYRKTYDREKLLSELRVLRTKLKRPLLGKNVAAARKKWLGFFALSFRAGVRLNSAGDCRRCGQETYTRGAMIEILRRLTQCLIARFSPPILMSCSMPAQFPRTGRLNANSAGWVKREKLPVSRMFTGRMPACPDIGGNTPPNNLSNS